MESNLDVNLIIQAFQEKLTQVITELIVKEATVKHLTAQIQQLEASQNSEVGISIEKKEK